MRPLPTITFDAIGAALCSEAFRPRALFERFNIELLATTESPVDRLEQHRRIRESGWRGRIITTYRPDAVVDPEHEHFRSALVEFGELTGQDVHRWSGYLNAHRLRRQCLPAPAAPPQRITDTRARRRPISAKPSASGCSRG